MDEDHFSIFQGEALRNIVAQVLWQDVEAEHALADVPAR
jgi:hypothetical protein